MFGDEEELEEALLDVQVSAATIGLAKDANVAALAASKAYEAKMKEADEAEEAKKEADEKQAALAKAEAETEAAKQSGDAEQAQRAEEAMKVAQQEAREAAAVAKREADEALAAQKVVCARSRGSCSALLSVEWCPPQLHPVFPLQPLDNTTTACLRKGSHAASHHMHVVMALL